MLNGSTEVLLIVYSAPLIIITVIRESLGGILTGVLKRRDTEWGSGMYRKKEGGLRSQTHLKSPN